MDWDFYLNVTSLSFWTHFTWGALTFAAGWFFGTGFSFLLFLTFMAYEFVKEFDPTRRHWDGREILEFSYGLASILVILILLNL